MIPAVHTRHLCCVYVYNMHVLVWVFETLVVIWLAVLYTPSGPQMCTTWGIAMRLFETPSRHTLLYDRARPRPRLSDRAGVSLCKCYEIVDSMVEATCLRIWELTIHIVRLVCGRWGPISVDHPAWMGCPSRSMLSEDVLCLALSA